jgi:5-formyltetrahydrofolate cyclo-ligase
MCCSVDVVTNVAKKATRVHLNKKLKLLTPQQIALESERVMTRLRSADWFMSSSNIGIYISFPLELDTHALIHELLQRRKASANEGIRLFIPHIMNVTNSDMTFLELHSEDDLRHHFEPNQWGILEPKPQTIPSRADVLRDGISLHLLLVPGLGFDSSCRRLGRGKGYYDKFLRRLQAQSNESSSPLLVGLSLQCQIIDEIPVTKNDIVLDHVITADNIYCVQSSSSSRSRIPPPTSCSTSAIICTTPTSSSPPTPANVQPDVSLLKIIQKQTSNIY